MLRATGSRLRSSRFLPPQFSGKLDWADKLTSQLVRLQSPAPRSAPLLPRLAPDQLPRSHWMPPDSLHLCTKKMQSSLMCCLGGIRRVPIPDGCPLRRPCQTRVGDVVMETEKRGAVAPSFILRFRQGLAPTAKKTQRHPLQDLGRSPTPPSATLCQARLLRSIQSDNYVSGSGCVLVVRDGLVACTSHQTTCAGLRSHVGDRTRHWRTPCTIEDIIVTLISANVRHVCK